MLKQLRKSARSFFQATILFAMVLSASAAIAIPAPPEQSISEGPTATLPSATDPRITEFNQPHMSWLPQQPARNQLLVFIPGTGGKPKEHFGFAETAASLGYHVISLMYPDALAAQKMCSRSNDPDAYLKFRLAIIQGGTIGPGRVIAPADCIESRLAHLLRYLNQQQPSNGWGRYLAANGMPSWSNIAVAGQSQGGGHAYMIAKYHKVARVIMTGSPKDFSFFFNRPAVGFDGKTETPLDRFFSFNHVQDNGHGGTHEQNMATLKQIGLTKLGVCNVDASASGFEGAHVLVLTAPLEDGKGAHGAPLSDQFPICPQVWKYMLTAAVQ